MSIIELYILFCITTSIAAIFTMYWPALASAMKDGIKNEITDHPLLSIFTFFILNIVLAPAIFITICIPSLHESAVLGIQKAIREPA